MRREPSNFGLKLTGISLALDPRSLARGTLGIRRRSCEDKTFST